MNNNAQIFVSLLYPYLAQAVSLGYSRAQLLDDLGLDLDMSEEGMQRMPFTKMIEAVHGLIKLTNFPALGLRSGDHFHPSTLGPMAYLIMNSPTVGEAYKNFLAYEFMLNEAIKTQLIIKDNIAFNQEIYAGFNDEVVAPIVEADFASLLGYMRFLIFRPELASPLAQSVSFRHSPQTDMKTYQEVFGVTVKFSQQTNCITFKKTIMDYIIPGADGRILKRAFAELEIIVLAQKTERHFVSEVYQYINEGFYDVPPTAADTAHKFSMSISTLQRRLKQESTTFKDLIEQVRKDKAQVYLSDLRLALADVAVRLGFSGPAAFSKAYKRWQGMTPAEYRNKLD